MMALGDKELAEKLDSFKENLKTKIEKANKDLAEIKFRFKTN
jgi:5-(carboxyamino)imidazole ribonucleotide mutase